MQNKIRKELFELQDIKYKDFHSSLCPTSTHIIGIRMPILRNYAKELLKQIDINQYLKNAQNYYYEEVMLQGMIICLSKISLEEKLKLAKNFIPKIDNWAICDVFCAGFKIQQENLKNLWDFIISYLNSSKEFELRFAIVMMLDHFINISYINLVLDNLNNIKSDYYYVKMAIAWAISICFIKFPDLTLTFLKNNNLDKFTYNKAIQKIIESYRVDSTTKNMLRKLKK